MLPVVLNQVNIYQVDSFLNKVSRNGCLLPTTSVVGMIVVVIQKNRLNGFRFKVINFGFPIRPGGPVWECKFNKIIV